MTFDMKEILDSKRAMRRRLADLPIAEKLRMLDALRQRELDIRGSGNSVVPVTAPHSDSPSHIRREK